MIDEQRTARAEMRKKERRYCPDHGGPDVGVGFYECGCKVTIQEGEAMTAEQRTARTMLAIRGCNVHGLRSDHRGPWDCPDVHAAAITDQDTWVAQVAEPLVDALWRLITGFNDFEEWRKANPRSKVSASALAHWQSIVRDALIVHRTQIAAQGGGDDD